MIDTLLSNIAPHLCFGCGKTGTLLCDNCKYNIIEETFDICVACGSASPTRGICGHCDLPYERAWCLGERTAILRRLLDGYKFENMYDAHIVLADLLSRRIGSLPSSTVIVPIPTISSHIRQRGYDHTLLLAKKIAKEQRIPVAKLLTRIRTTSQRGATKKQRIAQAKEAYAVNKKVDHDTVYLVVDDVLTTGATVAFAAKVLKDAGASQVWVAVVARQPLD